MVKPRMPSEERTNNHDEPGSTWPVLLPIVWGDIELLKPTPIIGLYLNSLSRSVIKTFRRDSLNLFWVLALICVKYPLSKYQPSNNTKITIMQILRALIHWCRQ